MYVCRWEELNRRCEARDKELNNALEKAKRFHGNRKKEIDWLDDTEKVIGLDDKVHGLPESCAKDIKSLEALIEEVRISVCYSVTLPNKGLVSFVPVPLGQGTCPTS